MVLANWMMKMENLQQQWILLHLLLWWPRVAAWYDSYYKVFLWSCSQNQGSSKVYGCRWYSKGCKWKVSFIHVREKKTCQNGTWAVSNHVPFLWIKQVGIIHLHMTQYKIHHAKALISNKIFLKDGTLSQDWGRRKYYKRQLEGWSKECLRIARG